MRFLFVILLLTAAPAFAAQQSQHLGALSTDRGMLEFQKIIDNKCTVCHTRERIDKALTRRDDAAAILERMGVLGADLTPAEKELLIAYWGNDQFAEVNRIINTRCTGCHNRQRIDQALAAGRNLDEIQQKMIRFGARLSPKEQSVLGIFSGKALK
ncbi:hypothetical protein C2E25_00190 [Geothermobacter hydrogeniphilus]|uniref:Cytochrome c domain-containing protein n=1 Tax=Geothermobacter hydrogeniphilus TaxID=1969733 RepID=A0A2K2HEG2_9BACT|nr:cytochrome c [Geothermobacter hydrogeniphilus]PNU21687.1 hypothetical protein C2E25_00190 [Geothermobacter hydrogeniphilus]